MSGAVSSVLEQRVIPKGTRKGVCGRSHSCAFLRDDGNPYGISDCSRNS